ncbi:hypothetical protein [uncultured Herbaspirillum sp.]|uniref:hypothetical protein n=1 Tax=uncultured Herbaspirillum sp. TaxID=160236 RepID=UPI0026275898|nr:hypothetical protein [uncultured Herbaspirillum sp.]
MNKLETALRYKTAAEIEQEATKKAQLLADKTAAELLQLAESMTTVTTEMRESFTKVGRATVASAQVVKNAAKVVEAASQVLTQSAEKLETEVRRARSRRGRYRELLLAVVLSAIVACVCQHLLQRFSGA